MRNQQAIDRATEFILATVRASFPDHLDDQLCEGPKLESPLEEAFYIWWEAVRFIFTSALSYECGWEGLDDGFAYFDDIELCPQCDLSLDGENYRLDFKVWAQDKGLDLLAEASINYGIDDFRIAVELDGHEFHERTKEQVALRDRRDRALQAAGWTVFHFSGSEFHRDPKRCVLEVYNFADQRLCQLRNRLRRLKDAEKAQNNA